MVECTALEMRRARKGTVGSNPTLSAIYFFKLAPRGARVPPAEDTPDVRTSNLPDAWEKCPGHRGRPDALRAHDGALVTKE